MNNRSHAFSQWHLSVSWKFICTEMTNWNMNWYKAMIFFVVLTFKHATHKTCSSIIALYLPFSRFRSLYWIINILWNTELDITSKFKWNRTNNKKTAFLELNFVKKIFFFNFKIIIYIERNPENLVPISFNWRN